MIPSDVLDFLLAVVAATWLTINVGILVDRWWFERRRRRNVRLRRALQLRGGGAPGSDDVRQIAQQLSVEEFQQLALDEALPPNVEMAVATELRLREGGDRLRELAQGERHGTVWDRIAALQVVVSGRQRSMYPALEGCLRSGERELAAASVRMLIRLDTRRSADILITALRDGAFSRSRLAAAFDRLSVARADLLGVLLDDREGIVRFWGARLAGRLHTVDWSPRIRELVDDADPLVRRAAVEALGLIGSVEDRGLLVACCADAVPMVRAHAARAAAEFADARVADALSALLADREWMVRSAAREALRLAGGVAEPALLRTLWHPDTFAANSAAEVLQATGAIARAAHRLLADEANAEGLPLIARFLEVAGPHLRWAFLSELSEDEGVLLLYLVHRGAEVAV